MSDVPISAPDIPTRDSELPNTEYTSATYTTNVKNNNNDNNNTAVANTNASSWAISSENSSPQLMGLTAPLPPVPFPRSSYTLTHTHSIFPFHWYSDWVRANPGNARQVEKLLKTFTMVITDPSNLINMEGCWSASKLFTFVNDSILNTVGRRVPAREYLALALHAASETECLIELLLRKYKGHAFTWNALLVLELVKLLGNATVHSQLFLMKWLWQSLLSSIRKSVTRLIKGSNTHPLRLKQNNNTTTTANSNDTNVESLSHTSVNASSNVNEVNEMKINTSKNEDKNDPLTSTSLVIPRVISAKRELHTHFRGTPQIHTAGEYQVMQKDAEQVPCNWFDFLGVGVDCYLLLRPVLLVGAARHVYFTNWNTYCGEAGLRTPRSERTTAEYCDEMVARLPTRQHLQLTSNESSSDSLTKSTETSTPQSTNTTTTTTATSSSTSSTSAEKVNKPNTSPSAGQDSLSLLQNIVNASPRRSLFSSWKWWLVFALLDVLVVLLSKLIKRKRVPVVYINDKTKTNTAIATNGNNSVDSNNTTTNTNDNVVSVDHDNTTKPLMQSSRSNNNNNTTTFVNGNQSVNTEQSADNTSSYVNGSTASYVVPQNVSSDYIDNGDNSNALIPSRDSLRVTQSVRNLMLNILRDPFFATVLRQFIYNKFVNGKLNRIPLLGAILSFQVGYFLSMQHFSFLYSAGQ